MAIDQYYRLQGRRPVLCTWAEYASAKVSGAFHVARTIVGPLLVSTAFTGRHESFTQTDEMPILFETLILGEHQQDFYVARCATYEEAETMHKIACQIAQEDVATALRSLEHFGLHNLQSAQASPRR